MELETSELADTKASLEQKLDNAVHANVVFDGVSEGTILERRENTSRSDLVFGMANTGRWRGGHDPFADQVFKERLDRVEFARNTLECVFFVFKALLELFEVVGNNIFGLTNAHFTQEN